MLSQQNEGFQQLRAWQIKGLLGAVFFSFSFFLSP
jgi:hypothetical protein